MEPRKLVLPLPSLHAVLIPSNPASSHLVQNRETWGYIKKVNEHFCQWYVLTRPLIDDGTAYLLYASDNNQNFKISKLDSNYYNVASQTGVISSLLLFYHIYGPF